MYAFQQLKLTRKLYANMAYYSFASAYEFFPL